MANSSTNGKSTSSLQKFLSPKLLQLHMHIALLSKNSMVQTFWQFESTHERYEFPKKIKIKIRNESENELKMNFLYGLKG
jgi:hypothetical protein